MTNSSFCRVVIVSVCLLTTGLCSRAQQRNPPPPGWEFVRKLDSVNSVTFHASGDTLFLNGEFSTNGGTTWDTLWNTATDTAPHARFKTFNPHFFPHTAQIWDVQWTSDGLKRVFIVSNGTSDWKTYPLDSMTEISMGSFVDGEINPFDDNDIFLVTDYGNQRFPDFGMWRSRDGGHTWARIENLPFPDHGQGMKYLLMFDARAADQWYLYVDGQGINGTLSFYRTTDNGISFSRDCCWGKYAGISAPGVFRTWWEKGYQYGVGIVDMSPAGEDSINWLTKMDSTLPMTKLDSGYSHFLREGSYQFFASDPAHAFVAEAEGAWNLADSVIKFTKSHLYETTNDGEIWQSIWSASTAPLVNSLYLDQSTRTLWATTFDSLETKWRQVPLPFYSLVRHRLQTDVNSFTADALPTQVIVNQVFPNPVHSTALINYELSASGPIRLEVFDQIGKTVRELYSGHSESGPHHMMWNIPSFIPSGTYFIRLKSVGVRKTSRLIIIK